jgi:hypothetical protein
LRSPTSPRGQEAIGKYTQQQIDAPTTAVAWSVVGQDRAEALAKLAIDEGGFGNYADKVTKIRNRVMGALAYIAGVKTVGVVEELPEKGLTKIAKPVGVVAALIPTTRPDATPPLKTLLQQDTRLGIADVEPFDGRVMSDNAFPTKVYFAGSPLHPANLVSIRVEWLGGVFLSWKSSHQSQICRHKRLYYQEPL